MNFLANEFPGVALDREQHIAMPGVEFIERQMDLQRLPPNEVYT